MILNVLVVKASARCLKMSGREVTAENIKPVILRLCNTVEKLINREMERRGSR